MFSFRLPSVHTSCLPQVVGVQKPKYGKVTPEKNKLRVGQNRIFAPYMTVCMVISR